ncbi:MAG: hypothetical protein DSY66_01780 [Persephonella sp.]|nr:MAG: hypothetical protein DSY53_00305 [Persephonella sp.]RUM61598.1 MAG: hypothetical protein DSY66_01780 [Persephonella sp.]
MRNKFFTMLLGATLGGITAYIIVKRNEELKNRIAILQEKLKSAQFTGKIKGTLDEILNKLNKVSEESVKSPSVSNEERERILREVEEKVEKLEELINKET